MTIQLLGDCEALSNWLSLTEPDRPLSRYRRGRFKVRPHLLKPSRLRVCELPAALLRDAAPPVSSLPVVLIIKLDYVFLPLTSKLRRIGNDVADQEFHFFDKRIPFAPGLLATPPLI